jgi:hypothetical protein
MENEIEKKEILEIIKMYFILKGVMSKLDNEKDIKEIFQEYQGKLYSGEESFKDYSSLESKVNELIYGNNYAKDIYLSLEKPKSTKSGIENLSSCRDEIKKKFIKSLKLIYSTSKKVGFSLLETEHIKVFRKSDFTNIFIYDEKPNQSTKFKMERTPYIIIHYDKFLGIDKKNDCFVGELFDEYFEEYIKGSQTAGIEIKRIIGLKKDIKIYSCTKLDQTNNFFNINSEE